MKLGMYILHVLFCLLFLITSLEATNLQLVYTDSDPDAFVHGCVNVINGNYCEAVTDIIVDGPDALLWQRFYNSSNYISGQDSGSWRMVPQRFLVLGNSEQGQLAFVGERSGGILPYVGKRGGALHVDTAHSLCNTFAKEMNGQTSHISRCLKIDDELAELSLGDGTKRYYRQVEDVATDILGEEQIPVMASYLQYPSFYLLQKEILPSGNQLHFSYDASGHLIRIQLTNAKEKTLSWIQIAYDFSSDDCQVELTSSDNKQISYRFVRLGDRYQLVSVEGSHCIPTTYEYEKALTKKILPQGRFVAVEYTGDKVASIKLPHPMTGEEQTTYTFSYGTQYTDFFDAHRIRTRYRYDKNKRLSAIERYDEKDSLYKKEEKYWD